MTTPEVQYGLLSPMLIVFGVAVLGVLVEAFVPRRARRATHLGLALAGLVAALVAVIALAGTEASAEFIAAFTKQRFHNISEFTIAGGGLDNYMNPQTETILDTAIRRIQEQAAQQQKGINSSATISSGAGFSGSTDASHIAAISLSSSFDKRVLISSVIRIR